ILGVCAVIYPLSISKGTIWKEIPLNLLSVGVLFTLANDQLIEGAGSSILSRIDGIVLMAFFIIFLYYTFGIRKDQQVVDEESMPGRKEESREKDRSLKKDILLILAGVITLPIGGQLVINGAMTITSFLGLSESFVGLTLVALGTSAPELATSAVATYKRNANIAIGNIVGSNLFNIFWVLGLSAVIRPLPVNPAQNIDLLVVAIATALLFMFIAIKNSEERWWVFKIKRENHLLSRTEGILFLILYAVYVGFLIWRG
ncbi:MAG: sodium:calcium antiporter, partial [Candidatus Gracilibacteria bacterium]|nr:sodium:calcium antiporter [Candidatus Gracilibacteria bacterium]